MDRGHTVLLYVDELNSAEDYSDEHKAFLSRLLLRDFEESGVGGGVGGGVVLRLLDESITPVHSGLQLYIVIRGTIKSAVRGDGSLGLSSFLGALGIAVALDSCVVDIELKETALERNLRNLVMAHERPDYQISYKSLMTDLTLHEGDLEASQEKILEYALDPKNESLLLAEDLLSTIKESESSEIAAREQIGEARRNIHISNQQVVPYRLLSEYASVLLGSIQKISYALGYFSLHVSDFEKMLSGVINEYKVKVSDNSSSIKAHVLHLKNQLVLRVFQKLQVSDLIRKAS